MEESPGEDLLKVRDVRVFTINAGIQGLIPGMALVLEDGREFRMYYITPEIAITISYMREGSQQPPRRSLFDFLAYYDPFKDALSRNLKRVVIDELDASTGLYNASVELEDEEGFKTTVKMIPSHAVFLAVLAEAPIYVHRKLIEVQELEEGESGED